MYPRPSNCGPCGTCGPCGPCGPCDLCGPCDTCGPCGPCDTLGPRQQSGSLCCAPSSRKSGGGGNCQPCSPYGPNGTCYPCSPCPPCRPGTCPPTVKEEQVTTKRKCYREGCCPNNFGQYMPCADLVKEEEVTTFRRDIMYEPEPCFEQCCKTISPCCAPNCNCNPTCTSTRPQHSPEPHMKFPLPPPCSPCPSPRRSGSPAGEDVLPSGSRPGTPSETAPPVVELADEETACAAASAEDEADRISFKSVEKQTSDAGSAAADEIYQGANKGYPDYRIKEGVNYGMANQQERECAGSSNEPPSFEGSQAQAQPLYRPMPVPAAGAIYLQYPPPYAYGYGYPPPGSPPPMMYGPPPPGSPPGSPPMVYGPPPGSPVMMYGPPLPCSPPGSPLMMYGPPMYGAPQGPPGPPPMMYGAQQQGPMVQPPVSAYASTTGYPQMGFPCMPRPLPPGHPQAPPDMESCVMLQNQQPLMQIGQQSMFRNVGDLLSQDGRNMNGGADFPLPADMPSPLDANAHRPQPNTSFTDLMDSNYNPLRPTWSESGDSMTSKGYSMTPPLGSPHLAAAGDQQNMCRHHSPTLQQQQHQHGQQCPHQCRRWRSQSPGGSVTFSEMFTANQGKNA